MKLAGLCDKDTATGLRLAGVKELFIPAGDELPLWKSILLVFHIEPEVAFVSL